MVLYPALTDREQNKFLEVGSKHTVRVMNINNFSLPEDADAYDAQYPDAVTEIYRYFQGGLGGVLLKTVTIIYVDATHDQLLSVVYT
jgi:hypothetical protein